MSLFEVASTKDSDMTSKTISNVTTIKETLWPVKNSYPLALGDFRSDTMTLPNHLTVIVSTEYRIL